LQIARLAFRAVRRRQARRALIAAVKHAVDATALRRLLLADADCRTLAEWSIRWVDARACVPASRLNAACFGRDRDADLRALKRDLLGVIRREPGWSGMRRRDHSRVGH